MPGPRPLKWTDGGWNSFTHYGWASGALGAQSGNIAGGGTSSPLVSGPGDFQLQSGGGRLELVLPLFSQVSGWLKPVIFYDAAVPISGGPCWQSGHRVVGILPGFVNVNSGSAIASGLIGGGVFNFVSPYKFAVPFLSGLCVSAQSGQSPFTVTWSTEPAPPL